MDLCAKVFYKKRINGKLYPRAAGTSPFAFAEEMKPTEPIDQESTLYENPQSKKHACLS